MPTSLDVYLLPSLVEPERIAGRTAVVIDVLRATTTIVHALASGAAEVRVCQEVDDARRFAADYPGAVLAGERGGLPIPGFQLGNSPLEFTPAAVGGKTVLFTTTNGTRAMARCQGARRVLLAAFVNFSAICRELSEELASPSQSSPLAPRVDRQAGSLSHGVAIVCAGTDGEVTREDTLLAGAIVDDLAAHSGLKLSLNDQAEIAADAWRSCRADLGGHDPLGRALRHSRGGRNLIEIGLENDIAIAAEIDKFDLVPVLDLGTMRVTAA
ncbi:MAG TPA: 2-phosphosulfolactate phosphatase [Pirellulaceae bacterium]|nr:2-phosphosulfolactate phosphatase [Pirellulaceae bacterium]